MWLTQARALLNALDSTTTQGRRERAILAVGLGGAQRRPAVAALTDGRSSGGFTGGDGRLAGSATPCAPANISPPPLPLATASQVGFARARQSFREPFAHGAAAGRRTAFWSTLPQHATLRETSSPAYIPVRKAPCSHTGTPAMSGKRPPRAVEGKPPFEKPRQATTGKRPIEKPKAVTIAEAVCDCHTPVSAVPCPTLPAGTRIANREPCPGSLATVISPPIIWQNFLLIANPRPVPLCFRVTDPSTCEKG